MQILVPPSKRGSVLVALGAIVLLGACTGGTTPDPDAGTDAGSDGGEQPSALFGWELTASNTGLAPHGLNCDGLERYTGRASRPLAR